MIKRLVTLGQPSIERLKASSRNQRLAPNRSSQLIARVRQPGARAGGQWPRSSGAGFISWATQNDRAVSCGNRQGVRRASGECTLDFKKRRGRFSGDDVVHVYPRESLVILKA
jgi:hypothetical protein